MLIPGRPRFDDDRLDDDDRRGCMLLIGVTMLVCVSAFLSWRELMYLCWGEVTEATVLRVYDVRGRGAGTVVDFEFTDPANGAQRRHSHKLPLGWQQPAGPLRVEYVPGSEIYARVAGHTQRWALWVFGGSLIAAAVYLGLLVREANTPIRRMRRYNRGQLD